MIAPHQPPPHIDNYRQSLRADSDDASVLHNYQLQYMYILTKWINNFIAQQSEDTAKLNITESLVTW